mmetsp:Transcript_7259/g.26713  ORF Transcript_7259/g.26713 Transcript_7259/m.26713 type:complete len:202 (+) Transcript_7259:1374-1979(+)
MGVQEQELLVSCERPLVGWHLGLRLITQLADADHSLQTQNTCLLSGFNLISCVVNSRKCLFEGLDGTLEASDRACSCLLTSRDDIAADHVNHGQSLDVNNTGVVLQQYSLACCALLGAEYAHLAHERSILIRVKLLDGLHTRVNSPDALLNCLCRPSRVVSVAVKDALRVRLEEILSNSYGILASLYSVCNDLESLCRESI